MKAIGVLALTIGALLQGGPAVGAATSGLGPSEKIVCHDVLPTGTIMKRALMCMSQSAWHKDPSNRWDGDDYTHEYMQLKAPAQPEILKLGTAKWDKLPRLRSTGKVPYVQLVAQARDMLRNGTCSIPGQTPASFDIEVHYGVTFDAAGKVSQVLVEDSRCAMLNALVGLTVLARAERGDFAAASRLAGWQGDRMNFTLQ